jgi:hypothetical protein
MVLNIKIALDECAKHLAVIQRRNNTLIDYHIYPDPVPSAIATYAPKLVVLQSRLRSIQKLNFSQLEQIFDDPDCLAALHLKLIVSDLLNAISNFTRLFQNHYDTTISQRGFYTATYENLQDLRSRLDDLSEIRQSNPNRARAEHLVGRHNASSYRFCSGAIQVLNDNDHGRIAMMSERDLLKSNHATLASKGGAFLWWICPSDLCAFKLRFHLPNAQFMSIENTPEVRSHPSIPLEYRSRFLIKSHLHASSDITGVMKYGCLLCFAEGKPLQARVTTFSTGKDLAIHICGEHKGAKEPPAMVLEKVKFAINGDCPVGVRRWDANLLAR